MQWVLDIPDAELARISAKEGIPRKLVAKTVVRLIGSALESINIEEGTLHLLEGIVPLTDEEAEAALAARAAELIAETEQELGG
jgi:hypothetical protein